jgi:surface polysaccharide O-acyltransferase-like enzyme
MSVLPTSQNKRRAFYRNLSFGVVGLLILAAVARRVFDVEVHGFATILAIAVFFIAILQFNALDEVAKQAHYVAWYWGSMIAIMAIAVATLAAFAFPEFSANWIAEYVLPLWGGSGLNAAFMAGLMTGPLLLLVGFGIWWSVFWLRRR